MTSVLIGLPVPFSGELMLMLLVVATMPLEPREAARAALLLTRSRLLEADMVLAVRVVPRSQVVVPQSSRIIDEMEAAAKQSRERASIALSPSGPGPMQRDFRGKVELGSLAGRVSMLPPLYSAITFFCLHQLTPNPIITNHICDFA